MYHFFIRFLLQLSRCALAVFLGRKNVTLLSSCHPKKGIYLSYPSISSHLSTRTRPVSSKKKTSLLLGINFNNSTICCYIIIVYNVYINIDVLCTVIACLLYCVYVCVCFVVFVLVLVCCCLFPIC